MLREELLQSKNDEIARCLLSRKRKLSELYFATVGFAGATENASADPLYHQKEQAFLDANDLSKGRYFNETTLPSFTNYAALRQREVKETAPPVEVPSQSNNATPISPPAGKPSAPQPVTSNDRPKPQVQQLPEQKPATPAQEQLKPTQPPRQPAPGIAPEGPQGLDVPTPAANIPTESDDSERKANPSIPKTPTSVQGQENVVVSVSPAQSKPNRAVGVAPGKSEAPSLRVEHGKRPSIAAGGQVHVEQPLSPVSSGGPYSSNTPIPAAASPDTSPAEDSTELVSKAIPEQKPEESGQAPSTLVPSTPDEQLRLEEAQSLQQSTLAASKAIGDGGDDLPSTNEVIQENVVPAPSGPKDSSKELQEPVPAPAPSDLKKPEEAVAAAQESPVLTQQKSAQITSPVETTTGPATPLSKKGTPPSVPAQPERMTTRVSSGAIRHKSVSEILGEAPKSALSPVDKGHATEKLADSARPVSDASSTSAAKMRLKDRKAREKERSKLSTVVFPKQPPQSDKSDAMDLIRQQSGELARLNEEQDYLYILFQNRAYTPPRGSALNTLLASAHKTLTTENHLLEYHEQMDSRTLRRIYALQNANRWPLRQLKRSLEPPRQGTHWDVLLDHVKWMRTDFREERKWKIAAAKSCADWCAEYVNSDQEHRSLLRVHARIPTPKPKENTESNTSMMSPPDETGDEILAISHPTPDLVPSMEEDSLSEGYNDEPRHDLHDTVAPAAIFSLGSDEFNFSLDMTPAAQKLLDELPIYAPVNLAPDTNLPDFKEPPDSSWKTDLLPLSKYVSGKIAFQEDGPPRKRSRYDYSQYQSDPEHSVVDLPPEQTNVALFRPENKHIRDRIHPGHAFRPPAEYSMPSVGFFESRNSSQWTYAEDDELRRLVKEYAYNWSLISSCLTPSSLFTSGAERRTPWECFERWIGLEGLPADLSKTQYFRAYHQRLETAQRTVLAQQQAAQQQQQQQEQQQQQQGNTNPQTLPPVRRRSTQPVRVDRRRSSKHLALLDAMRKLAKKRETMLQKQQHASQLASLRKVNEANQPKPPLSTPAEFSRLKYERDVKLQERQEHYRQQMIAQQRANLAAQRAGQIPNQQQMMNAPGRNQNGMPNNSGTPAMPGGTPNGMPNGMPNGLSNGIPPAVGVNQGRPHMQGMPGGGPVNSPVPPNPMAMKMMPQSGMPQNAGGRPSLPMQTSPDNARVLREANRLQEQQRVLQSRQQQPQPQSQPPQQAQPPHAQQPFHNQQQFVPQGSHSPSLNMPSTNGTPNNPAMMAAMQAGGGMQSPSFHNGTSQGVSTPSPRMGQPNLLSNGVVPTISSIQNQIQRNNPNMPPEQVNKLATDRLHQFQQQRMSQVAMNSAAGNIGAVSANYQVSHDGNFQPPQPGMNGGPGMQVPQAQGFSPMMRVAQNAQQGRVGVGSSPAMNGTVSQPSRSATPQNQRSGSAQAGPMPGSSKSPNPPQAQTAGS